MTVGIGNGPVNAIDSALRQALIDFYPTLKDLTLTDYKVMILSSEKGTGAITRVHIESTDDSKKHWTTVGVSSNIIDASYNAIFDSITLYDDKNLTKVFKEKHKEVLSDQHGGGFWIWKYDIIKQKLNEIADGDYLVYLDAGCVINQAGKERFYEYFNMLNDSSYGIISFRMDHKEYVWTTSQIFNYFNINYNSEIGNSGQAKATALIMLKKPHLLKIL